MYTNDDCIVRREREGRERSVSATLVKIMMDCLLLFFLIRIWWMNLRDWQATEQICKWDGERVGPPDWLLCPKSHLSFLEFKNKKSKKSKRERFTVYKLWNMRRGENFGRKIINDAVVRFFFVEKLRKRNLSEIANFCLETHRNSNAFSAHKLKLPILQFHSSTAT